MATGFQPPQRFNPPQDANQAQAWREWKEQFELYLLAAEKQDTGDAVKIGMLKYAMGPEWIKVSKTFTYETAGDDKKFDKVMEKFTEHFEPKKLLKAYVTRFQRRIQGPSESLSDYISSIRELASQCEFGDSEQTQICIQISNGVRDKKLRESLWEDDLALEDIIKRCHKFDQLRETRRITGDQTNEVNAVTQARGRGRFRGRGQRGASQAAYRQWQPAPPTRGRGAMARGGFTSRNCSNCGYGHAPRRCPAFGKTCHGCGNIGHFGKMCRKTQHVRYAENNNYDNDGYDVDNSDVERNMNNDFDALNVQINMTKNSNVFMSDDNNDFVVELVTKGKQCVKFVIDTAADTSIMSRKAFSELKVKPKETPCSTPVRGLFGAARYPDSSILLPVEYKGYEYMIECQIVDNNVPNLLSKRDSLKLGLVKRVYNVVNDVMRKYKDVFQGIGRIPGDYTLHVAPDARPVALNARPLPAALREPTRAKLCELEKKDIIVKVPVSEPTPWCSALHVVPKKKSNSDDGKVDVRITIDPQHLNKALKREYHPITTIEDVITRTDGSKYFTVLDANQGYFQIGLDAESQKLTTFNTPFGRYMYKRLPMGITSAPEIYQRAMHDMFADIDGVEIVMDDILVHAPTLETHDQILEKVLARCREKNLKLNEKKTKLRSQEVTYIGHKLTSDGVKIDENKVKAVLEMPEPTSIANVQTLLGMVTYTCKFLPNLSQVTEPLRYLIKESNQVDFKFHFDEDHKRAFQELKSMMTNAPVLKYYSTSEPITVSGDASQAGLGTVLLQSGRPVAYGSKALTETEKNYSQIEKEMLAIVFGLKKFHTYVYGRNDVTIETDHLPLVRIFEKPLHQVPLRLQKMRMAVQQYDFKIVGKSGKDIPVADALSRAYLPATEARLLSDVNHANIFAVEVRGLTAFSEKKQEEVQMKTKADPVLQELIKIMRSGWPNNRQDVAQEVRKFWDSREEMSVLDGIVFKGDRVVIPETMQQEILKIIHASHLGIVKCKQLARDIVYRPGMKSEIEKMVERCPECQENKRQQQNEPMVPTQTPERPWQVVAADLLQCSARNWLVVTDYYSDFIEVEELCQNTYSSTVIEKLARIFAVHGRPDKLITDNGPQFRSHQFHTFVDDWGMTHSTTSPYHHQANGKVERANQTVRHMLEKVNGNITKFYYGLLQLRNTPNPDVSPGQRLMSRRTATKLPTSNPLLQPQVVTNSQVKANIKERHEKSKRYYNRKARNMEPLRPSDTIRMRMGNKWKPAQLTPVQPSQPRSYNLETEDGKLWRRNRKDILKTKESNIFQREPREFPNAESPTQRPPQNPVVADQQPPEKSSPELQDLLIS